MKKRILMLILLLAMSITACQPSEKEVVQQSPKNEEQQSKESREFMDSLGRKVEIPMEIQRIAPSGHYAQQILYSVDPDRMIGWGRLPGKKAQKFIDQKYLDLPEFGAFYGKKANLNVEALLAAKPDIIIDIGEVKKNMQEDLDKLSETTGLPVVFIEAKLTDMPECYRKIQELLGDSVKEKTDALISFCDTTMKDAINQGKSIPEDQKLKVYLAEGDQGLQTSSSASIHSEAISVAGAINVDQNEKSTNMQDVTIEQILQWNPDVILLAGAKKADIMKDPLWKEVKAVQENRVYQVPDVPYNWLGRPPAANRLMGVLWLGNTLYPESFQYDLKEKTKEFYQLFYNYNLSDEEYAEITENSMD